MQKRKKIGKLQIDEDVDLTLLEKCLVDLHRKIGNYPQRIVVVVYVEESDQEFPQYEEKM